MTRMRTSVRRRLLGTGLASAIVALLQQPARAVRAANGAPTVIGTSNTATNPTVLTDKVPDNAVLLIRGGTVGKATTTALAATGNGPSAGYGAVARGGPNGSAKVGGPGLRTYGGAGTDDHHAQVGSGLVAIGGKSGTGTPGNGGYVYGGNSSHASGTGAWVRSKGAFRGKGVRASGAPEKSNPSASKSGNCGTLAVGGQPTPGTFGPGLVAMGGHPGDLKAGPPGDFDEDIGGEGIVAQGGLLGETSSRSRAGIFALHENGGPGLLGRSIAESDDAVGVFGTSENGQGGLFASEKGIGVVAIGDVEASASSGDGAIGIAEGGVALAGATQVNVAVLGVSANAEGGSFVAATKEQYAVHARNAAASPSDLTPVGAMVIGNWVVENGIKSAAVPTSRGLTLLYAVEGPAAMFEDVGTVRLTAGRARVDLDPIFAETIDTSELFVFLSARGETAGVYVASQDARGFEIREQGGGISAIEVSYRVTARRKGLNNGHRLAPFTPKPPRVRPALQRLRLPTVERPTPPHPKRPHRDPEHGQTTARSGGQR